jgi:tyrosine-specific transport protein
MLGSIISSFILGLIVMAGTAAVDGVNRIFMVGLVITYFLLLIIGLPHIQADLLGYTNWMGTFVAIPLMVISFGYHNLVPTITEYLEHNKREVVKSIVIGSSLPLFVYLLWNGLILGLIPEGYEEAMASGDMATQALRKVSEAAKVNDLADVFAFFALVTSFLAVALSLVDFLRDGFHKAGVGLHRLLYVCLAIIPPLVFAIVYPKAFLMALGYAGGFATVILFGVLPALMAWRGRYIMKIESEPILPGGKCSLIAIIVISGIVVIAQLMGGL